MEKLYEAKRISPRTYNERKFKLEKWVEKEKLNIN